MFFGILNCTSHNLTFDAVKKKKKRNKKILKKTELSIKGNGSDESRYVNIFAVIHTEGLLIMNCMNG